MATYNGVKLQETGRMTGVEEEDEGYYQRTSKEQETAAGRSGRRIIFKKGA